MNIDRFDLLLLAINTFLVGYFTAYAIWHGPDFISGFCLALSLSVVFSGLWKFSQ